MLDIIDKLFDRIREKMPNVRPEILISEFSDCYSIFLYLREYGCTTESFTARGDTMNVAFNDLLNVLKEDRGIFI